MNRTPAALMRVMASRDGQAIAPTACHKQYRDETRAQANRWDDDDESVVVLVFGALQAARIATALQPSIWAGSQK